MDDTDPELPVAVPVTEDDRVRLTVRPGTDQSLDPVVEKDSDNVGQVLYEVGGESNIFDIVLAADDTAALDPGDYIYDVKINFANGEVQTPIIATMRIIQPATSHP